MGIHSMGGDRAARLSPGTRITPSLSILPVPRTHQPRHPWVPPSYLPPSILPWPCLGGSNRQILGIILPLSARKARKQPREPQSREYRSNKQQVEAGDWCCWYEKEDRQVRSSAG